MLSGGEVGVAEVAGDLQHSDDPLHVTGEAEAVVSHDQQLHNCRERKNVFYFIIKNISYYHVCAGGNRTETTG